MGTKVGEGKQSPHHNVIAVVFLPGHPQHPGLVLGRRGMSRGGKSVERRETGDGMVVLSRNWVFSLVTLGNGMNWSFFSIEITAHLVSFMVGFSNPFALGAGCLFMMDDVLDTHFCPL